MGLKDEDKSSKNDTKDKNGTQRKKGDVSEPGESSEDGSKNDKKVRQLNQRLLELKSMDLRLSPADQPRFRCTSEREHSQLGRWQFS